MLFLFFGGKNHRFFLTFYLVYDWELFEVSDGMDKSFMADLLW